ncbi:MAG: 16S rRNA (uracil(1498)-N(3))-methyltransferase [Mycoplasma sp.]|nr:16S rRNA (uracil(1498)-N(3))-methyltransferase [Mycoplasma sp.]
MYRFFVEKKIDNKFELSNEILNHLKVLRIGSNEKFYCIYDGEVYLCHREGSHAIIEIKTEINNEYANDITLFASIINIKRFEWLIQKATELGVNNFYPMITKNTNIKFIEQLKKKKERFIEISKNASEQSFRNKLTIIHDPINFEEAVNYNIENKYIAHEKKEELDDQNLLFKSPIAFYVGPEGGFDENEINKAINSGLKIISLGKRILRSETSSIYLLSRIQK